MVSTINDSSRSTSPIPVDTQASTTIQNQYKDSKYNKLTYQLSEGIYIFENNLFTREIQPIDYNKEREIFVQCTLCKYNKTVSLRRFQSSNFVQHYKIKHPNIAYNAQTEATLTLRNSIPTKTDFFNTKSRKRTRTNTIIEFNEDEAYHKLLKFIIDNNLSFNILNSDSFKDLLNYYNKSSPVINRWKIKNILEKTYNDYFTNFIYDLKQNIASNGTFSLSFDIWTSNTQTAYIGIIIIYINSDFQLTYRLIGFDELTESHTGLYLYTEFFNIISQYFESLTLSNILSFTRDNASNNDTFIDTFLNKNNSLKIYDIRCITHIINIVVNDILKEYLLQSTSEAELSTYTTTITASESLQPKKLITKIRRLVTLIKYTTENRKLFLEGIEKYKKEGVISTKINNKTIPLDNTTRWNSTYHMIKLFLDLKPAITYTSGISTNKEFKNNTLTETEWATLIELKAIFEIFVKPTIKLQGEIYTTLNKSLLFIYQIFNKLEKQREIFESKKRYEPSNVDYNNIIQAINNGIKKLTKYYPRSLTPNTLQKYKPYLFSIILDPRFKLRHFKEEGLLYFYDSIHRDIITLFKNEYFKVKAEIKGKSTTITPNLSFDELAIINTSTTTINTITENETSEDSEDEFYIKPNTTDEEYILYFREPIEIQEIHPLTYWKNNAYKFPILSVLARRFLAIPATSASVERLFSIAGNILTKSRNRLYPTTAKQLILLKSWMFKDITELENEVLREKEDEKQDISI